MTACAKYLECRVANKGLAFIVTGNHYRKTDGVTNNFLKEILHCHWSCLWLVFKGQGAQRATPNSGNKDIPWKEASHTLLPCTPKGLSLSSSENSWLCHPTRPWEQV